MLCFPPCHASNGIALMVGTTVGMAYKRGVLFGCVWHWKLIQDGVQDHS